MKKVAAAGIAEGVENNNFAPEAPVTFNQAVKMLVSAVGYTHAENNYPEAFINIAEEIGVTD